MPAISLKKLAKILGVDFVVQITCDNCASGDVDLLTYSDWDYVQIECNKCMKENRIELSELTEEGC